jgi:hypothetical protein
MVDFITYKLMKMNFKKPLIDRLWVWLVVFDAIVLFVAAYFSLVPYFK